VTPATATPRWLLEPEFGLCPCGCIGKRRKSNFVEKTIGGAAAVMRQAMFAEDVASKPGLLQRIDSRVKVITVLALLLTTALVRSLAVLIALYAATLVLALASRLSLSFFVKRVWLFIPIFSGVIVLPATLNVITPGHVVVPLGSWFGQEVGLTSQGLMSAALIVTRVAASISLVVLLTLTTPWAKLLAALRALFVPRVFVLVLGMAYRYLFQLLGSVTDMYTARRARMVARDNDVARGRVFVAASAGALFGKSHALAEEVHMAMVARGYTGEARAVTAFRFRTNDALFAVGCVAAACAALGVDRVIGH
jgi:cobalt/nickel transport system permease protein